MMLVIKDLKFLVFVVLFQIQWINAKIIKPGSSQELASALSSASQGDTIQMLPMHYKGDFVIPANSGPATLTGDSNSTIESEEGGGNIGLHVQGNNWKIKSFWIKGPNQGLLVDGNGNTLEGIVIQKTTNAMVIKGEENVAKSCVISEAEFGIVMEGSKNSLYYNSVNIQTPAIIIKEGTCCGTLDGNVANGEFNLDGTEYKLIGNVANHGLYIKGCNNQLMGNVANGARFPEGCGEPFVDLGGNVFRGLGPGDTDLPSPNQPQYQEPQQFQNLPYNSQQNQQQPQQQGFQRQQQQQNAPVRVEGNTGNGPQPKCQCTCAY